MPRNNKVHEALSAFTIGVTRSKDAAASPVTPFKDFFSFGAIAPPIVHLFVLKTKSLAASAMLKTREAPELSTIPQEGTIKRLTCAAVRIFLFRSKTR